MVPSHWLGQPARACLVAAMNKSWFGGKVKVDESYFSGKRKGRVAEGGGENPSFRSVDEWPQGLHQDHTGCVFGDIDADHRGARWPPNSIVNSDGWKGYNVLDVSGFNHFLISYSERFVSDRNHINGIEIFWNRAKRQMLKSNGVRRAHFRLF